jgi:hypothetical protein
MVGEKIYTETYNAQKLMQQQRKDLKNAIHGILLLYPASKNYKEEYLARFNEIFQIMT